MGTKTSTSFWIIMMLSTLLLFGCGESQKKPKQNTNPNPLVVGEDKEIEYSKAALANVELGLGYLAQGQVARAKTKITHALKLAPSLAECHSAMAFFLEKVGDAKEAEKSHKKAVKYSKSTGAVYNNYGGFLCRQGRFEEADNAFQSSFSDKNYSRTAEVYENAGICAMKWQEVEKAQNYFTNAIRHDPKRSTALLELAQLGLKKNDLETTKQMLSQYKKVAEVSARSLWLNIQMAKAINNEDAVASHALLLKNLFEDSLEYQHYIKSEMDPS